MIIPWYIYYPLEFFNWLYERPRLTKALVCATIVALGFLVWWFPAHAATPDQIVTVITKVQEKTVEATGVIADPKDGTLYKVGVRDTPTPSCGQHTAIGVSTISIMLMSSRGQTNDLTSMSVITPYAIPGGTLMLLDLDGNGTVDSVAPMGAIPNEVAQPIFDEIIACIARIR